jgi:ABC-2 type transport system ATP-binding protein
MTMRVRELVEFTRAHYDDPHPVHDVLAWCGITDLADRQAGGLSGGERRRLALALALAGRPRLVVLDEPTAGLDVDARAALWERLRWFRDHGGSVLLTTHDLTEAEQLADRVAVVDRGRVVATDTPADLRRTLGTSTMRFDVARRALDGLRRVAADATVTSDPAEHSDTVEIVIVSRDTDEVVRRLVGEHVVFRRLRIEEASLEDAIRTMAR